MGVLVFFAIIYFIAIAIIKGHNEASSGHSHRANRKQSNKENDHSGFKAINSSDDNSLFEDSIFSSTDTNPATGLPMFSDYGIDICSNAFGVNNSISFDDSFS